MLIPWFGYVLGTSQRTSPFRKNACCLQEVEVCLFLGRFSVPFLTSTMKAPLLSYFLFQAVWHTHAAVCSLVNCRFLGIVGNVYQNWELALCLLRRIGITGNAFLNLGNVTCSHPRHFQEPCASWEMKSKCRDTLVRGWKQRNVGWGGVGITTNIYSLQREIGSFNRSISSPKYFGWKSASPYPSVSILQNWIPEYIHKKNRQKTDVRCSSSRPQYFFLVRRGQFTIWL